LRPGGCCPRKYNATRAAWSRARETGLIGSLHIPTRGRAEAAIQRMPMAVSIRSLFTNLPVCNTFRGRKYCGKY
jgi:hypothetical protein